MNFILLTNRPKTRVLDHMFGCISPMQMRHKSFLRHVRYIAQQCRLAKCLECIECLPALETGPAALHMPDEIVR